MNPEVKKLWIDALRSGEYKQTKGILRREGGKGGYCCLGVLCDLHAKQGLGNFKDSNAYADGLGEESSAFLTLGVVRWAGLKSPSPAAGHRCLPHTTIKEKASSRLPI